ncbi:hypothetical protein [Streptomyces sp. CT34]|uniref:hypothetical protein n=1 Tax=Streptomyces sp. CT34 TaxID=1553907 RepID=UPI000B051716|nr:hypothetical protein [Streptomyces sp. CT34]
MNGADPDTADDVPFVFVRRGIGVPRDGETFTAEEPQSTPAPRIRPDCQWCRLG